jgi:hypothetical protein
MESAALSRTIFGGRASRRFLRWATPTAKCMGACSRSWRSELDFRPERRAAISDMAAGSLGSAFLDVDATVDAYCAQHNSEKPTDVDKLVELHIKAVLEWLQTLTMLNHNGNAMSNRPEAGERSG